MTATAMVPIPPSEFASRPCWTCRQRRVVCDTRLPHCVKCTKSGRECLGFGEKKPVIWVTGMASRGKMAGRTTFASSSAGSTDSASISSMLIRKPLIEQMDEPEIRHLEYCEFSPHARATLSLPSIPTFVHVCRWLLRPPVRPPTLLRKEAKPDPPTKSCIGVAVNASYTTATTLSSASSH